MSLGVGSASATINGVTVAESGAVVSSNEDINGKTSASIKGQVGALNANLSGNSVGVGAGIGPASVSVSADLDQLKNAASNFFNNFFDLIINGKPDYD